jgi:hypothetical protein
MEEIMNLATGNTIKLCLDKDKNNMINNKWFRKRFLTI